MSQKTSLEISDKDFLIRQDVYRIDCSAIRFLPLQVAGSDLRGKTNEDKALWRVQSDFDGGKMSPNKVLTCLECFEYV